MTGDRLSRRNLVRASSFLTTGLLGTLSGCPSPGATVLDEENSGGSNTTANRDSAETNGRGETPDGGPLTAAPTYGEWFDETDNYDGLTVVVPAKMDSAEVTVGATGNGGSRAFDPPAIAVATGTTLVWNWTGEGDEHNVVAEDGSFDSGTPSSAGETQFEHRFSTAGVYKYACEVHRTDGMKGAVAVYSPETNSIPRSDSRIRKDNR